MNLNNTYRTENLTSKINLIVTIMGILVTAVVLVANNTNELAIAQADSSNTAGCAQYVKVTISHIPKQTSDATVFVALTNTGPGEDGGYGNITIPGIGSANLSVYFRGTYSIQISDVPGQNDTSHSRGLHAIDVCNYTQDIPIGYLIIPGVGAGVYEMIKTIYHGPNGYD
jgi:hypothetical protein